jgi:hypothetical protein
MKPASWLALFQEGSSFKENAYMTPEMAFECLLVSQDAGLRCTMSEVFNNFSIVVESCLSASQACEMLPERNPGAHFVLRKPVSSRSATESLKSAYHRMLLDYRLKARYPVMTLLSARENEGRSVSVTVMDIGEGGMGISSKEKLAVGDELSLTLRLPQTRQPIRIQVRIIWTREFGTAGCDFLSIPPVDRDILRDWLKGKTRVKKPLISV